MIIAEMQAHLDDIGPSKKGLDILAKDDIKPETLSVVDSLRNELEIYLSAVNAAVKANKRAAELGYPNAPTAEAEKPILDDLDAQIAELGKARTKFRLKTVEPEAVSGEIKLPPSDIGNNAAT
jgi:hypothetical protein